MDIPKVLLEKKLESFRESRDFKDHVKFIVSIVELSIEKGMTTVQDIVDVLNKE